MSLPFERVPRLGDAEAVGHLVKLAAARTGSCAAVAAMVGQVELHHVLSQLRQLRAFGLDLDAVGDERRARGWITPTTFNFNETQTARTKRFQRVRRAELR